MGPPSPSLPLHSPHPRPPAELRTPRHREPDPAPPDLPAVPEIDMLLASHAPPRWRSVRCLEPAPCAAEALAAGRGCPAEPWPQGDTRCLPVLLFCISGRGAGEAARVRRSGEQQRALPSARR
ncbi:unnamed protein product [Urochloa humidicola]